MLSQLLSTLCSDLTQYAKTPVTYRNVLYNPKTKGIPEYEVVIALFDISQAVNRANYTSIDTPPGFTEQLRIQGINPISHLDTMFAYIFWNPETCRAVFAFTGTEFISEWIADLWFIPCAPNKLNGYKSNILVHTGFYEIYMSIRDKLWDWYNTHSVHTLFITGHSLGGALSSLCAFDFGVPCHHVSFAAPRSGNIEYTQTFLERVPDSIRINNTEDIVCQLPLAHTTGYIYQHTHGNINFTKTMTNIVETHTVSYNNLPKNLGCLV